MKPPLDAFIRAMSRLEGDMGTLTIKDLFFASLVRMDQLVIARREDLIPVRAAIFDIFGESAADL